MHGFVRQLFDYDGSNLFPRTRPDAFVSCLNNSDAIGITTIGELVDTSYMDPSADWETDMGWEPEFIYRVNPEQNRVTGDASGTMKAAKISQIPGLKFDAVLTEDLSVTNIVGIAGEPDNPNCPNGIYPAGTLLETIIIDILTRGASIYDVIKYMSKCNFTVSLGSQTITNTQTLELEEGAQYVLDYGFVYTDGSFGPSSLYTNFAEMNSTGSNAPHFRNGILWADSSISEIKVTEAGTAIDRHLNPDCDYSNRPTITWNDEPEHCFITVKPDTTVYKIQVFYTANQSSPKKSNGEDSNQSLPANSPHEFTFTINAIGAKDVTPNAPHIIRVDSCTESPTTLIVEESVGTNTDIVVKSYYDIEHNTSTGIWKNDDVSLNANITRRFFTGYYTPQTGYDTELFNTNNNVNNGQLPAGNEIDDASWQMGTSVSDASYNVDINDIVKVDGSISMSNVVAGTNTVKLHVHYTESSDDIRPIKSNGVESDVIVSPGTITLTGTFNASTDIDVDPHTANVIITDVRFTSGTPGYNSTVGGYIEYSIKDAFYTPSNQAYSNSIFEFNNEQHGYDVYSDGGLYKMDASCTPFSVHTTISNGDSTNNFTPPSGSLGYNYNSETHTYDGSISFSNIHLLTTNTFKVIVGYQNSDPNIVPYKLSNRPSGKHITANEVNSSTTFKYDAPVPQYHYIVVTTTDSGINTTTYEYVDQLLTTSGYTTHYDQSETTAPSGTKELDLGSELIGSGRKVFVVAAPVYYNANPELLSNGTNQGANFTLVPVSGDDGIPYSSNSTDGIKYRLFKYKNPYNYDPYGYVKINLYHNQ